MLRIKEFFALDDLITARWGHQAFRYVDYCGLLPVRPLENGGYECTPTNTLSFARTGGDGVHFSLLDARDETADGPVVMTVPMAEANLVVAETLSEFLGIGCQTGWFELEQLAYDAPATLAYYAAAPAPVSAQGQAFLDVVRTELRVAPVALTAERLADLEQRFGPQLQVPPFEGAESI
ncbi:hypothetical protein SAMN02745146_3357 [Hymenobacter daecheongensis DSM 21074]|uniref:Uncharacterized protein n=1 Tax=Hymenobacter daecheongensis DSM 21074 TaxID=1121955 RepID=A0A1M6K1N0_9BACT|nr:hypothetical protein [Hymenobacter daecheongensis]SHJ52790.1 hypothetical protein SAMN02745146_3357 [Hymenobacter daecheongensis DSM 21074]